MAVAVRRSRWLVELAGIGMLGLLSTPAPASDLTASFSPPSLFERLPHAWEMALPPAGILRPYLPEPIAPPPVMPAQLPAPPTAATAVDAAAALQVDEVLASVQRFYPLLVAAEQERLIAAGNRLTAEGAFDLNLRSRAAVVPNGGIYDNQRYDVGLEQPTLFHGVRVFGGYRLGLGDFPVYYGDRKTADGGEFRYGILVPILRDGPIDRQRATLRKAQLTEAMADPVIQRLRLEYLRNAARAYWAWVAAGEQYRIAERLKRIAQERQEILEARFRAGQLDEFPVVDNRRLLEEREGFLIAAERRFQETSLQLSLFLRDADTNPMVPAAARLPQDFQQRQPARPEPQNLRNDIETALTRRPELQRLRLQRESLAVDLRLADNQLLPALNLGVAGSQDAGPGKKELDRSNLEISLLLEIPLQRREARGRAMAAQGGLLQLTAQEQWERDRIIVEVQDAVSTLDRTYQRLSRARAEQREAERVLQFELERYRQKQVGLLEVNVRELSAAGAQSKVVDALADYYRAEADYRLALGLDAPPQSPKLP